MLFKDDHADDDNVWQLFLQDGGEKGPQVAQEREGPTKMTPRAQASGQRPPAGLGRARNATCRYRTIWHEGTHGT